MFTNNNDLHMLQFPPLPLVMEKRWNKSSHVEIAPSCPRCASPNTKFCYYNNYSLSQPRYFCKGCRRYWTKGGSLRNVPVGGGCRKYRRSRTKQSGGGGTGINTRTPPNPNTDSSPDSIELADAEPGNIDLAAVYANYLNQNSGSQNYINGAVVGDQDVSSGASCASYDQFHVQNSENMVMEFEKSFDLLDEEAQILIQDDDLYQVVSIGDDNYDHDFVSQTPNAAYNLQLNEDNLQLEEITWMINDDDVATNNSPNFMWESAVQWQDQFGSIPSHDQLKISANFINQNWSSSSTDLSGLI